MRREFEFITLTRWVSLNHSHTPSGGGRGEARQWPWRCSLARCARSVLLLRRRLGDELWTRISKRP